MPIHLNIFLPQHFTSWIEAPDAQHRALGMKIMTGAIAFAVQLLPQFEVSKPCPQCPGPLPLPGPSLESGVRAGQGASVQGLSGAPGSLWVSFPWPALGMVSPGHGAY